jgi:CSLREA domain-containing protein
MNKRIGVLVGLTVIGLVLMGALATENASAVSNITVTTTLDVLDGNDGLCSLREAVIAANLDTASGLATGECPAGSGADMIILRAETYTLTRGDIFGAAGPEWDSLDITSTLTISGAGSMSSIISANGGARGAVEVYAGVSQVTLTGIGLERDAQAVLRNRGDISLQDVRLAYSGQGLYNGPAATASLDHVTVVGTTGGVLSTDAGIYNEGGVITLTNSLVYSNTSFLTGGIANRTSSPNRGMIVIRNTSVFSNTSQQACDGAIHNEAHMIIEGSVIMNNARNGNCGDGIYNSGSLTVTQSSLTGNAKGVVSWGTLVMTDTIIENNADSGLNNFNGQAIVSNVSIRNNSNAGVRSASFGQPTAITITNSSILGNMGGGVDNGSSGIGTSFMIISESMIANNTNSGTFPSSGGGGIRNGNGGKLYVINSTISGNSAYLDGGGIYNYQGAGGNAGLLYLYNTTVANNRADGDNNGVGDGGGIRHLSIIGTADLKNTLVAGNMGVNAQANDLFGVFNSLGYNLIQNPNAYTLTGVATGNIVGVAPNIGSLQNNGGPTLTHALLPGSPAIDAGNPAGCTDAYGALLAMDQRGFLRWIGSRCDIGAYEYGSLLPISFVYLPFVQR